MLFAQNPTPGPVEYTLGPNIFPALTWSEYVSTSVVAVCGSLVVVTP